MTTTDDRKPLWAYITPDDYADLCEKHLKSCTTRTETFTSQGLEEFVKDVCTLADSRRAENIASANRDAYEGAREDLLDWKAQAQKSMAEVAAVWELLKDEVDAVDYACLRDGVEHTLQVAEEMAFRRGEARGFNEANGGPSFMGEPALAADRASRAVQQEADAVDRKYLIEALGEIAARCPHEPTAELARGMVEVACSSCPPSDQTLPEPIGLWPGQSDLHGTPCFSAEQMYAFRYASARTIPEGPAS